VRAGHAAENLAVLRHVALNRLRREPTATVGIQTRRLMAGWDDTYPSKSSAPEIAIAWAASVRHPRDPGSGADAQSLRDFVG
jgi:hypothetical protein